VSREGEPPQQFRIRSLTGSVYLPNLLFAIGQGAAVPVIALLALDLGASPAVAGAVVALRGLGTMLFDVPAGVLVARYGDRRAMTVATIGLAGIAFVVGLRPSLPLYAGLILVMGFTWSVWALARLSFATEAAPLRHRGRVMSIMGGTMRIGQFIGPLLGGLAVVPLGLPGPFFIQAALAVAAAVSLLLAPGGATAKASTIEPVSMRKIASDHRRSLTTAGFVAVTVQVLRSSRQAVIPLWGDQIGLNASQVSFIFGASAAVEMLFFYPVGMVMDRYGRRWTAIPCLLLLSVGMALIPVTSGFGGLLAVGLFLGFANGLGSGINLTLGSDLSPDLGRSQFLGLWRLVTDVGTAGGPLLVAAVTSVASLGAAPAAVAVIGLLGAGVMWKAVPETLIQDLE
jgi:MFS family permease